MPLVFKIIHPLYTKMSVSKIQIRYRNELYLQSFPKKDLLDCCFSNTDILPASQNGRETRQARFMDRNLVNLFWEMTSDTVSKILPNPGNRNTIDIVHT